MKNIVKRTAAILSAAAAAATAFTSAAAYSCENTDTVYTDGYDYYDYYDYYGEYDYPYGYDYPYIPYEPSDNPVSGKAQNSEINPDNGEYLIFTVTNSSDHEVTVADPAAEGQIQRFTGEGWVYISGGSSAAVPYYEEYNSYIYPYENSETIPPYSSYTDKMNVGSLEDGDYRLEFYTTGYRASYIYFTVCRSVSAVLPQKKIYEGDETLTVRIRNNLPAAAAIALDSDLATLERYESGKWKEILCQNDESYDFPELPPYETSDYIFPLDDYGYLEAGKYRLTFGWSCGDELPLDYPESLYGSVTLKFTVEEPVSMKIIPSSSSKASDMYVSVKITNNTDRYMTASDYGKLYKMQGTRWVKVNYKRRAKEISGYKRIAPHDTEVIRINLADYYNTNALGKGSYRIEVPINGETVTVDFKIVKDKYYVIK